MIFYAVFAPSWTKNQGHFLSKGLSISCNTVYRGKIAQDLKSFLTFLDSRIVTRVYRDEMKVQAFRRNPRSQLSKSKKRASRRQNTKLRTRRWNDIDTASRNFKTRELWSELQEHFHWRSWVNRNHSSCFTLFELQHESSRQIND